jgi:peptidoglycan/xylan/chitin deacetylase (PgdA/CDA1 family)
MALIILNFHGVGPVLRNVDEGERNCWLDQNFFEAVLDVICGRPNVRLTVDDGNASDFEVILPALLRRRLRATFFICSGRLDHPTFLKRAEVRELPARGMGIGSHGVEHLSWRHMAPARLSEELTESRRILQTVCSALIESAACPFGAYDRAVLSGLRRAGYRWVFTSDRGWAIENQWLQPRTTVTRGMTLEHVERLVQKGFGVPQQVLINVAKLLKRLR